MSATSPHANTASSCPAIPVSHAEIRRLGIFALRALGLSFSVADRAVDTLAAVEAVTGSALAYLQQRGGEVTAGAAHSATCELAGRRRVTIDAGGKSLLELSPAIADIALAEARANGRAAVEIESFTGALFACDVLIRIHAAHAGILAALDRPDTTAAVDGAPFTYIAGSSCESAGNSAWSWGQMGEALGDNDCNALTAAIAQPATRPVGHTGPARLRLFVLDDERDPAIPRAANLLAPARADTGWVAGSPWSPRIRDAIGHGVMVEETVFDHFVKTSERAWAPSSDRSRRQNG